MRLGTQWVGTYMYVCFLIFIDFVRSCIYLYLGFIIIIIIMIIIIIIIINIVI